MVNKIPDELLQGGRTPDPIFPPEEKIFIRFKQIDGSGNVAISEIRYVDQSGNRSKYCSRPSYILLPNYDNWGYGSISIKDILDIPGIITTKSGVNNSCEVAHMPLTDNYSHSEIWTYRNGVRATNNNKKKKIAALFRIEICQKINILKNPQNK
jgi:hypothetical protein